MKLFYTREENEKAVIIVHKNEWIRLAAFATIILSMFMDDVWGMALILVGFVVLVTRIVVMLPIMREVKKGMAAGNIAVTGKRFSRTNPTTITITK